MTPRIAYSVKDAWEQINELDRCINCQFMINRNLFGGTCLNPEGLRPFDVSDRDRCECFRARDKKVGYWINKLVGMAMEFSGDNDFSRRLAYHQANGTDHQFLFGK